MIRTIRACAAAFTVVLLAACGGSSQPADAREPGEASMSEATSADGAARAELLLGLTLHLENGVFDAAYFASLDDFAATFEAHDARITFEPRESVVAAAARGLYDWRGVERRGHAVGSHAAIGGTESTSLASFTAQAKQRFEQLAPHVTRLGHVSGNCGDVDWVTGIVDAGFTATTASTVLCLYSIPSSERPSPYESLACRGATDPTCHTSYPSALAERVHPWRAASGASWLTDDPSGKLVVLPGSGSLPCLEEEATSTSAALPTCTLTREDVIRALAELDEAVALAEPSKVNTFYWVWGSFSISDAEKPVLEELLAEIDARKPRGVRWATVTEMVDAYVAWEKTHR